MNGRKWSYALLAVCLVTFGCASQHYAKKTQRELDIDACTYGANVPSDMPKSERKRYIEEVAVPACMRAKNYPDAAARGGAQ